MKLRINNFQDIIISIITDYEVLTVKICPSRTIREARDAATPYRDGISCELWRR